MPIQTTGHIEVITGCMFSGKTEEVQRRCRRAVIARQTVQVFKPKIDDRYDANAVVSHEQAKIPCAAVSTADEIRALVRDETKVVLIDEAQFFSEEIIAIVEDLAASGRRVIVAGLDLDSDGQPFGPLPALMAVAEYVDKLHAVCVRCGQPASRTVHKGGKAQPIEVGVDQYEARCRSCAGRGTI